MKRVNALNLTDVVQVIRKTSEEAMPINGIGMLHIDGNHSEESSLHDVKKWVPLVQSGGVIVFDDVTWGTTDAAVAWLDENCYRVSTFYDLNVWGVWIKP